MYYLCVKLVIIWEDFENWEIIRHTKETVARNREDDWKPRVGFANHRAGPQGEWEKEEKEEGK